MKENVSHESVFLPVTYLLPNVSFSFDNIPPGRHRYCILSADTSIFVWG